jgi:L-asparaginase
MLTDSGISVVACSQCLYEPSDFSVYEVGRKLLVCGIIPGQDMTTEAAVTKLMWALGQTGDKNEIRRIFATNYAGEIDVSLCPGP